MNISLRPCFFWVLISCNVSAANLWREVENKQGIKVYQQAQPSGFNKFKATTTTSGCIGSFEALLADTQNANKWLSNVDFVRVLAEFNGNENYVYTRFSAPWPVKDRDMVTYSIATKPSPSHLQIGIRAASDFYPAEKDFIRIDKVQASWIITEQDKQQIKIEYQVSAEPGGSMPKWLSNKMTRKSTYQTFVKLKQRLSLYGRCSD